MIKYQIGKSYDTLCFNKVHFTTVVLLESMYKLIETSTKSYYVEYKLCVLLCNNRNHKNER